MSQSENQSNHQQNFEEILGSVIEQLNQEILVIGKFQTSNQFEARVRDLLILSGLNVNHHPKPQAFPDIAIGEFGVEVKFTEKDTWRSVANSISEGQRVSGVELVYLVYGKMGGIPEVRWGKYGDCIVHVRTSHRLRFEVAMDARKSLFKDIGITYEEFRKLPESEKMHHIRQYAQKRRKPGEYIWWLD